MDIRDIEDLDMPFRTGKYQGQTVRSVLLRDRNYVMWCAREREEMLKPHKAGPKYKSPFRDEEYTSPKPQYGPQTYKSYGGGYKSNEEKIRENFERWSTLEAIQGRHFEDPPEGPSRYQLDNPASWGKPIGEIEEGEE